MPIWPLIVKFWWAPLAIGAALWIAGLHTELSHVRSELVLVQGDLAAGKALGKAQAARADLVNRQEKERADDLEKRLQAEQEAHGATAVALADRVRQYLALRGSCAVPGGPSAPGGHPEVGPVGPDPQRVADALARLIPACQADYDQLEACRTWAAGVRCH